MKAIVQHKYGTTDSLELANIAKPEVGPTDVLIRVAAASVHLGDWHIMTGKPYLIRLIGIGLRAPKVNPGMDVAGTVEAVGAAVTRFAPGDEVFGTGTGTFAEYAIAAEQKVVSKPANVSFEQAAVVPTSGFAALQAVHDSGAVQPGQRVLVIGAGGGVGSFAVQLAKSAGAAVTGVCSTEKLDLVRGLGADHVIDYTVADATDGSIRYDVVIDTAGHRSLSQLRRALTRKGTLVVVGSVRPGLLLGGFDRNIRAQLLSPFVSQNLRALATVERLADLEVLRGHLAAGSITPVLGRIFPLQNVPEAMEYLAAGHATGKVVVAVQPARTVSSNGTTQVPRSRDH
ncbi:NAD(P)-dependent alcohol dehydrogenase [Antrihabitans sp. YC2-6]|uniref:NAD(P)-dependent alcohol dehydrogenase n=1 Tax=Antrihabitans sp. YC2-6 TaxID=2799498 RepID=UPI0018F677D3|nr:NAD(P)-dependent alcohol dehydrogenase [Antrihabitans sp. YC2-6]MBJ8345230.1 NAD(P)-dependent alcohol dehydrogenase [Antrihabitans sp. YC2-6]